LSDNIQMKAHAQPVMSP